MITIRKSEDRGHFDHGWLQTYHTFSFAGYRDPDHMGFRALRVINEDRVQAGEGFGTHPHRDMEIITYVTEGALRHRDSMGSTSVINAGEVQRMTAGTGVTHSEMNESEDQDVHLFQIWIEPERLGLTPGYEQRQAWPADADHGLRLLAAPDGDGGQAMTVHQDVAVFLGRMTGRQRAPLPACAPAAPPGSRWSRET